MRIGHAHLKVRDLERAERFYADALGLTVRERVGRFSFLSGTDVHHELALQKVGAGARQPGGGDVGLFHIAFEVANKRALATAYERLTAMGLQPLSVDHRISWAIYFADPDGNGLEIYCDTRGERGIELWDGVDRPLSAERLLAESSD